MKPSNGLEIAGKRLAMTLLQRSDELLGGFLRDFLDCSAFISVLLCGDLVPSLEAGGPKNRDCRRMEKENSRSRAEGNRRDASLRVARRCASGKPICSVRVGLREGEGVLQD